MGLKIALGIISLAFLILTAIHARNYRNLFPGLKPYHGIAKVNGVSLGVVEFHKEINQFVAALNRTQKSTNLYAAIGYCLSFVATVISLIVLCVTD